MRRVANVPKTACFSVHAAAEPSVMPRVMEQFAKRGFDVGKIDGVLGAASRDAIRAMQVKYGLPADGYPTAELLSRMSGGQ